MTVLHCVAWLFAFGAWTLGADMAHAQIYPIKPIRIITAATAGSSDFTSRLIAPGLT